VVRDLGFADAGANESRVPSPESRFADLVRDRGPLTVAAFMELALYDPELGYYARAAQRSGRAGDFFTSVDVGPVFGELLAVQVAEMHALLSGIGPRASGFGTPESQIPNPESRFDLVEAGAGNGRLSADILRALRSDRPALYARTHLHLVETSAEARAAQRGVLGDVADRLSSSSASLPESFDGVLIANELLDALPVHQVVMRDDGLREVYVCEKGTGDFPGHDRSPSEYPGDSSSNIHPSLFILRERPVSTVALSAYLERLGVTLEPGWRAEINLRAVDWIRDAARRLRRGFIILIDYGHEARELYSPTHAQGTLTTFARHTSEGPESADTPAWLQCPGERDITAHVDFTSVRAAAEDEGLQTLAFLDQTYFVLGLMPGLGPRASGFARQLKTLLMPGGLGSTHKVMILGKGVGTPMLQCGSFRMRVT
jgi:SAM-dependent MidA family methyltransferase